MGTRSILRRVVPRLDDAGERPYECLGCGRAFAQRRQVCPECNGYSIERREFEV